MLDIKAATGYQSELWLLDLQSFASVKAFADKWEQEGSQRLDILVENAGIMPGSSFTKTTDEWETW